MPGGVEHLYNRVVREEHIFRDEGEDDLPLAGIGETKQGDDFDDFVVMADCMTRSTGARWKQSIEPLFQPAVRYHELAR